MGTNITWVAPYSFNQRLPFDIDYKVIGTFMEFYTALMRFINFKLYKDIGLSYPPEKQYFSLEDSDYLDAPSVHK
jgi:pescadillo protein